MSKDANNDIMKGNIHLGGLRMPQTSISNPGKQAQKINRSPKHPVLWRFIRTFLIWIVSLCIVLGVTGYGVMYLYHSYLQPVNPADTTPVKITIPKGASISKIADILMENNLIRNKGIFKILVDFSDQGNKLKPGDYELAKNMEVEQIIDRISLGNPTIEVKKFTIPEGKTIEQTAEILASKGIIKDAKAFLMLCEKGEKYIDFDFMDFANDPKNTQRKYILEGFMFPDTYEVFLDATDADIIEKMLNRFSSVFNTQYMDRAKELNMTTDQIVTLASIIEREGKTKDFAKISAVFHNRLNKKMPLGSDVTIQYILKTNRLVLTNEDIAVNSPYNTYKNPGLPLGPISNPGKNAIQAALYPDEAFMKEGYYFFVLTDPRTGELAFSKTDVEHNAQVAKYKPVWQEYDNNQSSKQ